MSSANEKTQSDILIGKIKAYALTTGRPEDYVPLWFMLDATLKKCATDVSLISREVEALLSQDGNILVPLTKLVYGAYDVAFPKDRRAAPHPDWDPLMLEEIATPDNYFQAHLPVPDWGAKINAGMLNFKLPEGDGDERL